MYRPLYPRDGRAGNELWADVRTLVCSEGGLRSRVLDMPTDRDRRREPFDPAIVVSVVERRRRAGLLRGVVALVMAMNQPGVVAIVPCARRMSVFCRQRGQGQDAEGGERSREPGKAATQRHG